MFFVKYKLAATLKLLMDSHCSEQAPKDFMTSLNALSDLEFDSPSSIDAKAVKPVKPIPGLSTCRRTAPQISSKHVFLRTRYD